MQNLKIVFAGTPEIASLTLSSLIAHGFSPDLVLTKEDKPSGRGMKLTPSEVKVLAQQHNLTIIQPAKLRNNLEVYQELKALQADLLIVVAYGLIIPQDILDLFKYGAINIHVSLLPKLRGAAPIQRAILNQEISSGVTLMQMDAGLDTGDILVQQALAITPTDTSLTLHDKLAKIGAQMIVKLCQDYQSGKFYPHIKQEETQASYAHKLTKEEARINWNESAELIDFKVRGYNPFPIAWCENSKQELIKIHKGGVKLHQSHNVANGSIVKLMEQEIWVACGDNSVYSVYELQRSGSKKMSVHEFLLGNTLDYFI